MLFLVLFLVLSLTYNVSFFSNGKLNSISKICFLCVIYINYNTPIDSFAVRMRKTPKPYRVVLLEFRVKIFYSIKRWLTLARWTTVLTGLTGWKTGKNCLVNMDAFTQTTNAAVTLLSGKYSNLDSLWNRCTSYRNESGWVKSSLQSFVLFLGHFFLFLFHCLAYHENAFMF